MNKDFFSKILFIPKIKIIKRAIVLFYFFITSMVHAQVKPAFANKTKTTERNMNLSDSLLKGKYVVVKPFEKIRPAQNTSVESGNKISSAVSENIQLVSLPASLSMGKKIKLHPGTLCQTVDASFNACLGFRNGVSEIRHSEPLPLIRMQVRSSSNGDVMLTGKFKKNKRYLVSIEVMDATMTSDQRVYSIRYSDNTSHNIDFRINDRGSISFIIDTAGADSDAVYVSITLDSQYPSGGYYCLLSCTLEEI